MYKAAEPKKSFQAHCFSRMHCGGLVCAEMEYFVEEIKLGNLTIELFIQDGQGCRVIVTARDEDNRRVWKTPVMDANGEPKVYENQEDAIVDARKKLSVLM
jgi:hypothetical protein